MIFSYERCNVVIKFQVLIISYAKKCQMVTGKEYTGVNGNERTFGNGPLMLRKDHEVRALMLSMLFFTPCH